MSSYTTTTEKVKMEEYYIPPLPTSWSVVTLRRLLADGSFGIKIGPFGSALKAELLSNEGWKVYGQENIISGDFQAGSRFVSDDRYEDLSAYYIAPGDVLITMMGTAGRCRVAPPDIEPGIMDSHLLRLRLQEDSLRPTFLALVIDQALYVKGQIMQAGKGAIMHGLNSSIIKDLRIAMPPLYTQQSILEYLDRKTSQIDKLIAKKERQIELLNEKRAALISRAVTKGLNPDAKMKDSGIEWIGEIPEGWAALKLAFISESIQTGPFGSQLHAEEYIVDGIPIINPANISDGKVVPDNRCTVSDDCANRLKRHTLIKGDIVFGRRGEMGRCAVINHQHDGYLCGTGCLRVRTKTDRVSPDYLSLLFRTQGMKEQLLLESIGSTMDNLNTDILSNLKVLCPPIEEQISIVKNIKSADIKATSAIDIIIKSVGKLLEYRSALITAAVTGQIDVRGEAA